MGLGYVGLPTALGFAELGWKVTGCDSDSQKVAVIQSGHSPIYEPGVQELLSKHLASAYFTVTADVEAAIRSASILFICVGTPQKETGEADLAQVEALARTIAKNLNSYKLIVEKSTVPAITGQLIKKTITRYLAAAGTTDRDHYADKNNGNSTPAELFDMASNPEFLQEGTAVRDFFHPERIVCGSDSQRARTILSELYRSLDCPVLITDLSTAELTKHAANAFLATKISFINMVADICESVGADVTQVASGIGLDPRIGRAFLNAGLGFGGYCLPKDLRAFTFFAEEHKVDASLLRSVEAINQQRVERFLTQVRKALWILQGKVIGVLGLSFKAGTDDIREAPSLKLISVLRDEGAVLRLYDPKAIDNTKRVLPEQPERLSYCRDPYEAASGAHALLILTDWPEFRTLDFARIRNAMALPVLVDGRNLLDPTALAEHGFEYVCMGRPTALSPLPPSQEHKNGQDCHAGSTRKARHRNYLQFARSEERPESPSWPQSNG